MTPFEFVLLAAGGVVVFAGLLVGYTVLVHADNVLYPRAIGVLALALVAAGLGTGISSPSVPGGAALTLTFVSVAGLGYCAAGWQITADLLETEETVRIEPMPAENTGGFDGGG